LPCSLLIPVNRSVDLTVGEEVMFIGFGRWINSCCTKKLLTNTLLTDKTFFAATTG
jgi:hypothetical protein